jgi:chemotaxis protein CheY-P-specific phosphatase CheC
MNANDFQPFMEKAVTEVFESMCFITTEGEASEKALPPQHDLVCGKLDFEGVPSGNFGIAIPATAAATIAANFLGEDDTDLTSEQIANVVCELANMVCGTLLASVEPLKKFTLSSPRQECTGIQNSPNIDRVASTYSLDEGYIYTWLEIAAAA